VEDAQTRVRMVDKRLFKKLDGLKKEMAPPRPYGAERPETVLVGWGSTYGVMKEAVDRLNADGGKTAMLHFSEIYPFPEGGNYLDLLAGAERTVCVESNATGQFERLMRTETGYEFTHRVRRFDGRPFTVDYILRGLDAGS
jgi:2-oxoglutarate ferredoxin oxidoreductase subunit alpha